MRANDLPMRFSDVLAATQPLPPSRPGTAYAVKEWSQDDLYLIDLDTMDVVNQYGPRCQLVTTLPNTAAVRGMRAPQFVNSLRRPPAPRLQWWCRDGYQGATDADTFQDVIYAIRHRNGSLAPYWFVSESRQDEHGIWWDRQMRKCVMDDFGTLVEVKT